MTNHFVEDLIRRGVLKTPRIINAFRKIDRADFILPEFKDTAYIDEPLPIGEGQTISQPLTVVFMLELLQPEPGNKIFEIGFGSGWQTALLAEIIGESGGVYALERIKEIFEFGVKNISKYSFIKKGIVKPVLTNAIKGLKKHAPYDRIIAAASATEIPEEWLKELTIGGRLVLPIKNSIWLYIKIGENEFSKREYPGFSFVPLIND